MRVISELAILLRRVALFLLFMAVAARADARPEYAKREGVACLYCHERPGEARNFRGLYYAAHNHAFDGFDEVFEAKQAGVMPGVMGVDARPAVAGYPAYSQPEALRFSVKDIDGKTVNLGRFQGEVILIVNVASFSANTPQYAALQKLYERYKPRGFTVLAFPCNDFGSEEPGSDPKIKDFCRSQYEVTFPLFAKIHVSGDDQAPFFKFLARAARSPELRGAIQGSFTKILVNRKGEIVARYRPEIDPLLPRVATEIERQLLRDAPPSAP